MNDRWKAYFEASRREAIESLERHGAKLGPAPGIWQIAIHGCDEVIEKGPHEHNCEGGGPNGACGGCFECVVAQHGDAQVFDFATQEKLENFRMWLSFLRMWSPTASERPCDESENEWNM